MSVTGACKSQINITPYIDILLVLLIIFMVIQPTVQYDIQTRTPTPAPTDPFPSQSDQTIVVLLGKDGAPSLNQRPVTVQDLGSVLLDVLSRRADRRLFVKAHRDLPFGDVLRVIDIAKGAGAADVGLL